MISVFRLVGFGGLLYSGNSHERVATSQNDSIVLAQMDPMDLKMPL